MRILITGASGALLGAAGTLLRGAGHAVVGIDLVPGEDVVECDLRRADAIPVAVKEGIRRLGGLDVLVNGAGIVRVQDSGLPPDEGALALLDVNLLAPWRVTAAALPDLLGSPGRGRVVLIASIASKLAFPFGAAYSISKHGLVAYAGALRHEYGTHIDVVSVHPAFVRTPLYVESDRQGVGLDGVLPADSVAATAKAIARACTMSKPPHELPTTLNSRVTLAAGRHLPGVVTRFTDWSLRRRIRSGDWDEHPLTEGLRRRHGR
jgi:NAD(P)-dependent dehydrogenase (short-subunit alcohol dehydrogenase family)